MKAKDLAKIFLENPDFEVVVRSEDGPEVLPVNVLDVDREQCKIHLEIDQEY